MVPKQKLAASVATGDFYANSSMIGSERVGQRRQPSRTTLARPNRGKRPAEDKEEVGTSGCLLQAFAGKGNTLGSM